MRGVRTHAAKPAGRCPQEHRQIDSSRDEDVALASGQGFGVKARAGVSEMVRWIVRKSPDLEADIIGRACAVSYLFLIPAFLVYLIMKQYLLLAPSN